MTKNRLWLLTLALVAICAFLATAEPAHAGCPSCTCEGTHCGDGGNNTLRGNSFANCLDGKAGNDTIYGYGGNDTILGGSGDDTLNGEAGDDSLDGISGSNHLDGGDGTDTCDHEGPGGVKVSCELPSPSSGPCTGRPLCSDLDGGSCGNCPAHCDVGNGFCGFCECIGSTCICCT